MKPAPPVTSNRTRKGYVTPLQPPEERLWQVDLGVVAQHQLAALAAGAGAADVDLAPDEGVDDATGVDDVASLEDDGVVDLRPGDLAVVADGGERADERIGDTGAGAD